LCRTLLASGIAGLAVLPLASLGFVLDRGVIGLIALATFFAARSLGVVFPLVAQMAVPASAAAGRRAGLLYLTNIAGSAMGCLVTGFVLCDLLGVRALAMLLSALAISLASLLIFQFGPTRRAFLIVPSGAVLLLALFQGPLTHNAVESLLYKREMQRHPPLARVVENRYGIVAESPDGTVYGGGIYDGQFNTDLVHDVNGIMRAYSLSLFHAAPRQVFMIGLASGSWAQVVAANPMVQHLTVVEINPAYLPLIREQAQVASLLSNPKVSIIIDDANHWLRSHPDSRYDAVIANATYHYRANATTLLSQEFDRLIAQHLRRGGVYIYNTTDSARVQATGCENFRDGYRLFNFMVMGVDPLPVNAMRWRTNLLATRIDGRPVLDLGKDEDARQLDHLMMIPGYAQRLSPDPARQPLEACSSVMRRNAGVKPVTDDNMGTEWRYPLRLD
jgi:spermidine synthase